MMLIHTVNLNGTNYFVNKIFLEHQTLRYAF